MNKEYKFSARIRGKKDKIRLIYINECGERRYGEWFDIEYFKEAKKSILKWCPKNYKLVGWERNFKK